MWFLCSAMAEPQPIGKALFSQDRRALLSPSNRNQRENIGALWPLISKADKVLLAFSRENWANGEYLSTREDLQKQAIVQEFVLTKCFVDHKGRVSESIQNAFLQLMVNSFKSLAGCIWGRADQRG